MQSIDVFRKYVRGNTDHNTELLSYPPKHRTLCTEEKLLELIDAVEAEVKEYYMELPLDQNGEPIHVGDVLRKTLDGRDTYNEIAVIGVSENVVFHMVDAEEEIYELTDMMVFGATPAKCFRRKDNLERILKDVLAGRCTLEEASVRYAEVEKKERP